MDLHVRVLGETGALLFVGGRLDAAAAPAFKARIEELVGQGRVRLVCDLTNVEFLDSSGSAALVSGLTAARERGGFLKVVGANEPVARSFRSTRLDRVFELYPSVQAALA